LPPIHRDLEKNDLTDMLLKSLNLVHQNNFEEAKDICYEYLQRIDKVRYERKKYFEA